MYEKALRARWRRLAASALGACLVVAGLSPAAAAATGAQVRASRPVERLEITAPKGYHRAGTKIEVKVRGLEAGERYTIRIGKRQVAAGTAENARPLLRTVRIPRAKGRTPGPTTVRVTGDQPDRTDTTKVRVVDH